MTLFNIAKFSEDLRTPLLVTNINTHLPHKKRQCQGEKTLPAKGMAVGQERG